MKMMKMNIKVILAVFLAAALNTTVLPIELELLYDVRVAQSKGIPGNVDRVKVVVSDDATLETVKLAFITALRQRLQKHLDQKKLDAKAKLEQVDSEVAGLPDDQILPKFIENLEMALKSVDEVPIQDLRDRVEKRGKWPRKNQLRSAYAELLQADLTKYQDLRSKEPKDIDFSAVRDAYKQLLREELDYQASDFDNSMTAVDKIQMSTHVFRNWPDESQKINDLKRTDYDAGSFMNYWIVKFNAQPEVILDLTNEPDVLQFTISFPHINDLTIYCKRDEPLETLIRRLRQHILYDMPPLEANKYKQFIQDKDGNPLSIQFEEVVRGNELIRHFDPKVLTVISYNEAGVKAKQQEAKKLQEEIDVLAKKLKDKGLDNDSYKKYSIRLEIHSYRMDQLTRNSIENENNLKQLNELIKDYKKAKNQMEALLKAKEEAAKDTSSMGSLQSELSGLINEVDRLIKKDKGFVPREAFTNFHEPDVQLNRYYKRLRLYYVGLEGRVEEFRNDLNATYYGSSWQPNWRENNIAKLAGLKAKVEALKKELEDSIKAHEKREPVYQERENNRESALDKLKKLATSLKNISKNEQVLKDAGIIKEEPKGTIHKPSGDTLPFSALTIEELIQDEQQKVTKEDKVSDSNWNRHMAIIDTIEKDFQTLAQYYKDEVAKLTHGTAPTDDESSLISRHPFIATLGTAGLVLATAYAIKRHLDTKKAALKKANATKAFQAIEKLYADMQAGVIATKDEFDTQKARLYEEFKLDKQEQETIEQHLKELNTPQTLVPA